MVIAFVIWMACGFGAAAIASAKGNNGCAAALLGFALGPIGLLIVGLTPGRRPVLVEVAATPQQLIVEPGAQVVCPHCRSFIPANATVCRYCQRDVSQPRPELPGGST